jgi:hypothetical protein
VDTLVDGDYWFDELVEDIKNRLVIPVIGPEIFQLGESGETVYGRLAKNLAARARAPNARSFDDLAANQQNGQWPGLGNPNYAVKRAFDEEFGHKPLEISDTLKKLFSLPYFNLFITTTFDPLIEHAIDQLRFQGIARTKALAFTKSGGCDDLASDIAGLKEPTVYHLFGNFERAPRDYAITGANAFEYLCALLEHNKQPERLFDELRERDLLLIGCDLSDWLAYFFIRVARGERPMDSQRRSLFADPQPRPEGEALFLKLLSPNINVTPYSAVDLINRLFERLGKDVGGGDAPASPQEEFEAGDIFISYAREDAPAAAALSNGLRLSNLPTWFDAEALQAGDHWDNKIRRNIERCSLFIPVISRTSTSRQEGYFIREWNLACDRYQMIARDIPFILPVVIDDSSVPSQFGAMQWASLPGGKTTPKFCEQAQMAWRQRKLRS